MTDEKRGRGRPKKVTEVVEQDINSKSLKIVLEKNNDLLASSSLEEPSFSGEPKKPQGRPKKEILSSDQSDILETSNYDTLEKALLSESAISEAKRTGREKKNFVSHLSEQLAHTANSLKSSKSSKKKEATDPKFSQNKKQEETIAPNQLKTTPEVIEDFQVNKENKPTLEEVSRYPLKLPITLMRQDPVLGSIGKEHMEKIFHSLDRRIPPTIGPLKVVVKPEPVKILEVEAVKPAIKPVVKNNTLPPQYNHPINSTAAGVTARAIAFLLFSISLFAFCLAWVLSVSGELDLGNIGAELKNLIPLKLISSSEQTVKSSPIIPSTTNQIVGKEFATSSAPLMNIKKMPVTEDVPTGVDQIIPPSNSSISSPQHPPLPDVDTHPQYSTPTTPQGLEKNQPVKVDTSPTPIIVPNITKVNNVSTQLSLPTHSLVIITPQDYEIGYWLGNITQEGRKQLALAVNSITSKSHVTIYLFSRQFKLKNFKVDNQEQLLRESNDLASSLQQNLIDYGVNKQSISTPDAHKYFLLPEFKKYYLDHTYALIRIENGP